MAVVTKPLCGYGDGPGGASGWRFSVGPCSMGRADSVAQLGAGIAATLANTLAIAAAHGQFEGIRNLRRRPLLVSLAGTCRAGSAAIWVRTWPDAVSGPGPGAAARRPGRS